MIYCTDFKRLGKRKSYILVSSEGRILNASQHPSPTKMSHHLHPIFSVVEEWLWNRLMAHPLNALLSCCDSDFNRQTSHLPTYSSCSSLSGFPLPDKFLNSPLDIASWMRSSTNLSMTLEYFDRLIALFSGSAMDVSWSPNCRVLWSITLSEALCTL